VAVSVHADRIAPVFDVSRHALILDVDDGRVAGRREESFDSDEPVRKAFRLSDWGVHTLICGAISGMLENLLVAGGVLTISFVAGETKKVIAAFLAGGLPAPAFAMPGCRRRRRRRGRCGATAETWPEAVQGPGVISFPERSPMMPQRDGTGPQGQGPGTGRGRGRCRGQGGGGTGSGGGSGGRGQGAGPGPGGGGRRGRGRGRGPGFGRGGGASA
jgi:predicted Fe-Mo cluster-binding NifX family protein